MECSHPIEHLQVDAIAADGFLAGRCGVCGENVRVKYSQTWDEELDPLVTDMIEQEERGELPDEGDFEDPNP